MRIQLWNPNFTNGFRALDQVMDELFGRAPVAPEATGTEQAWLPPVDIVETAEAVELRADMPGLKATDLDIKVENGVLTIRGERKDEHETKGATYHTYERRYGTFARSFALPKGVDAETVKARYVDGVLTVTLPKKAEAKPKPIQIAVE
jgi:HSP20 family protein